MKMNLYWIDSYAQYDVELVNSVTNLFDNFYKPLLSDLNIQFNLVQITELQIRENEIIYNGKNLLEELAIAYINCINPSTDIEKQQQIIYEKAIKSRKLSVLNYIKDYPLIDKNKLSIISIAHELNIQTIKTIQLDNTRDVVSLKNRLSSELHFPMVIKPIDMFGGIAVSIVTDEYQLSSMIETLQFSSRTFVAQEKVKIISDCRVYIADGHFISCLKRTPSSESGLGNVAKGALSSSFIPPQTIIDKSISISNYLNATFLCVDWFQVNENEFVFNEIETAGGFVQLPIEERISVAKKMFRWRSNE